MKDELLKELEAFKDDLLHVIKDRKQIIDDYGSMDNYYMTNFKSNISKDFPLLSCFIKKRIDAKNEYNGNIDKFYIDLFKSSKAKIVEIYGSIGQAAIVAPINLFTNINLDKKIKEINEGVKVFEEIGVVDLYSKLFDTYNNYLNYINSYNLKKNKRITLSKEETIMYARKIIEQIDYSFVDDFNTFVDNNSIIFTNKNIINQTSHYINKRNIKKTKSFSSQKIFIAKKGTIDDVIDLVHEFIHFSNDFLVHKDPKSFLGLHESKLYNVKNKYTEFLSIFFEYYAIDYLKDKFNLSDEEVLNYTRNYDNKMSSREALFQFIPIRIYKEYKEFNFDTFRMFIHDNNIPIKPTLTNFEIIVLTFNRFKQETKEIQNSIDSCKNEEDKEYVRERYKKSVIRIIHHYNSHFLGSLLFYKIKNKVSKADILRFNSLLGSGDYLKIIDDPIYIFLEEEYEKILSDDESIKRLNDYLNGNVKSRGAI